MPRGRLHQLRRGTAAEWAAANPVLADGEPGYDETNATLKIGDGVTAWSSLTGIGGGSSAPVDPLLSTDPSWAVRITEPESVVSPFRGNTWRMPDLTGGGLHLEGNQGAVAPIRGGQWEGPMAVEQFTTPIDDGWVSEIDIRWTGLTLPRLYNPNEFSEVGLATVDQDVDYLEPAYIYQADGQTSIGMDWLTTEAEQTWRIGNAAPGRPAPDPHAEHTYRVTLDPTDAQLRFWIDGVLVEDTTPAGFGVGGYEPVTLPSTLSAPPADHPLGLAISGVAVRELDLRASIDGASLYRFDATDGADNDATVTTDGRAWSGVHGRLVDPTWPTDEWRLSKGSGNSGYSTATSPLGAVLGDSTWVCRMRPHQVDPGTGGQFAGHNGQGMFTGGSGWALVSVPGFGVNFGLIGGGSGPSVFLSAPAKPTDEVVVAFTFEASATRMFIDGVEVATGGTLHGIALTGRPDPFLVSAGGLVAWVAAYDRVLTGPELTALAAL